MPAGSFDCLVTSSTLNTIFVREQTAMGLGSLVRENVWYSPGIGIVRKMKYMIYPGHPEEFLSDDELEEIIRQKK